MNDTVQSFEQLIASFYGAKYGVAVDCCTHAIELCLRLKVNNSSINCPKYTYPSVPMTFEKLGLKWNFVNRRWKNFYYIGGTNIIDAAVYWKENGYIANTLMCLSFQFKKHLNLGRGGMILLDNDDEYETLLRMRYDGRIDGVPWAEQNIESMGYHYYMTPEAAEKGIERFHEVADMPAKVWSYKDYPDISKMRVFDRAK